MIFCLLFNRYKWKLKALLTPMEVLAPQTHEKQECPHSLKIMDWSRAGKCLKMYAHRVLLEIKCPQSYWVKIPQKWRFFLISSLLILKLSV